MWCDETSRRRRGAGHARAFRAPRFFFKKKEKHAQTRGNNMSPNKLEKTLPHMTFSASPSPAVKKKNRARSRTLGYRQQRNYEGY
jgi:hypothetical protein